MHDVGVALYEHPPGHFHAACFGNATKIIAAKVHEHGVLSTFLGIGHHLFFQGQVLFLVHSPSSCPCNGADSEGLIFFSYQQFRGSSQEDSPRQFEIEMVWGRIEYGKGIVHRLGSGRWIDLPAP